MKEYKRYNLTKALIESESEPSDKNSLWIDVDENTKKVLSVKAFENGEWITILNSGSSNIMAELEISTGSQGQTIINELVMPEDVYTVWTEDGKTKTYPVKIKLSGLPEELSLYFTMGKSYNDGINEINVLFSYGGISMSIAKIYNTQTKTWGEWEESNS